MTQAEQIYWRKFKSKNSIWTTPQEIAISAIHEALNLNADKVKNLEEENKRLMEGRYGDIKLAYDIGQTDQYKESKGWKRDYISGHDYYTKTFTNEQQTD